MRDLAIVLCAALAFPRSVAAQTVIPPATLIATESVSLSAPPLPVLPRSFVTTWRPAAPLNPLVGLNDRPLRAVLIAAMVPLKVIVGSAVPSPVVKARPVVPPSVTFPLVPARVTRTEAPPASTSDTEMAFELPVEKTVAVFMFVDWAPGTALTGASLTALTLITNVGFALVSTPLFVVPPLSWRLTVTVAVPLAFAAGV